MTEQRSSQCFAGTDRNACIHRAWTRRELPTHARDGRPLLAHRRKADVCDTVQDLHAHIDDPDLDVDADAIRALRGCGPKGYPGMPEVSNMPLPKKLLAQGLRDNVRICFGRMSGTAYGTAVLHVTPEAAAGGPLSIVETGEYITLAVPTRSLSIDVRQDDLEKRVLNQQTVDGFASPARSWERFYVEHVMQAGTGAPLDFLHGPSGKVSRGSH